MPYGSEESDLRASERLDAFADALNKLERRLDSTSLTLLTEMLETLQHDAQGAAREATRWLRRDPRRVQPRTTPRGTRNGATLRALAAPCPCACNAGGFCGGCGHAGCGRR